MSNFYDDDGQAYYDDDDDFDFDDVDDDDDEDGDDDIVGDGPTAEGPHQCVVSFPFPFLLCFTVVY